jgi:hypothetical protein
MLPTARVRRLLDRALVVAACALLVAVAAFWGLRASNLQAIQDYRVQASLVPMASLVNGLRIRFDVATNLAQVGSEPALKQSRSDSPIATPGRRLLLVSSDTCSFTSEILDTWLALIRTLPFHDGDGLTIVSFEGERIPEILRSAATGRGVDASVLLVTDALAWGRTTGIGGTPTTLALDEDSRVRLVVPRDFRGEDVTTSTVIRQFFAREI